MTLTNPETYQMAADIADVLLRDGVPVVAFSGAQETVMMVFQLSDDAAKYAARMHISKASPEGFREFYEAVR